MKILIACAVAPHRKGYTSDESLIQAFRDLGHEITTAGPIIGNLNGNIENKLRDIEVIDRPTHPEYYTYNEILDRMNGKPDMILQLDPHFYFTGKKPDIPCAYYIVDVHRGANVFRKMALTARFDYVFIAHKYFMDLFTCEGLNCFWLPRAYDSNYIKEYPEVKIQCDISFCGETGLSEDIETFPHYDNELDLHYHTGCYPDVSPNKRYKNWDNHTMEYSERAEILIRLSKDFNVRVYEKCFGPKYAKTICRGKIVVNHSLWKDSALRNFEVLACKRFLISDIIPNQDSLLKQGHHYIGYKQYFPAFLSNFDMEYEKIKFYASKILNNPKMYDIVVHSGNEFVAKHHTFKHRAQTIIDTVEGLKHGYTEI